MELMPFQYRLKKRKVLTSALGRLLALPLFSSIGLLGHF
jgi:hypothetical protein